MASKALQKLIEEDAPPAIVKVCGTCTTHWRPMNNRCFGQCLASAKFLPAPIITTDRQSCSDWDQK